MVREGYGKGKRDGSGEEAGSVLQAEGNSVFERCQGGLAHRLILKSVRNVELVGGLIPKHLM